MSAKEKNVPVLVHEESPKRDIFELLDAARELKFSLHQKYSFGEESFSVMQNLNFLCGLDNFEAVELLDLLDQLTGKIKWKE